FHLQTDSNYAFSITESIIFCDKLYVLSFEKKLSCKFFRFSVSSLNCIIRFTHIFGICDKHGRSQDIVHYDGHKQIKRQFCVGFPVIHEFCLSKNKYKDSMEYKD